MKLSEFIDKIKEENNPQEIFVEQYIWGNACSKLTGAVFYVKDNKFLGGYSLHTRNNDRITFYNINELKNFINESEKTWNNFPNYRYEFKFVTYKDCNPIVINNSILDILQ